MRKTLTAIALTAGFLVTSPGVAEAAVVSNPEAKIIFSGNLANVAHTVTTNATTPAGWHGAEVDMPCKSSDGKLFPVSTGGSNSATFGMHGQFPLSCVYGWGEQDSAVITDLADGRAKLQPLVILRRSLIRWEQADTLGGGKVRFSVRVEHWDPAGWRQSNLSPVRIQRLVNGSWQTLTTVTTNAQGYAATTLTLPRGRQDVRAYRLEGETVSAAQTAPYYVTVK